jgi:hypothetical protein
VVFTEIRAENPAVFLSSYTTTYYSPSAGGGLWPTAFVSYVVGKEGVSRVPFQNYRYSIADRRLYRGLTDAFAHAPWMLWYPLTGSAGRFSWAMSQACGDAQPKVAIYVRVSTDEQNPDTQLRDLREYVRSRGWQNFTEYVDLGFSGAKDSRPKWNELWDAVQKGRVHVLLTHALDRLGRSLAHLVKIIFTLTERNVTLISFRENIDLSTAQGRLIAAIFATLAEYELSMIRERTRAAKNHKPE